MFAGVQQPWSLGEATLDIPIRDASYEIEVPVQGSVYSGTGGIGGTAEMTGRPVPRARGGTLDDPIRNVTPVLIDPGNRVYQFTDGRGLLAALYERGAQVFTYAGDFPDYAALVAASVPSASYALCGAQGLFRLGAMPAGQITADVTGWVEETIEETLTFYRLPRQHHKHLKSTNMLERLNEEIKRRTYVVRIFPNAESCLRLVRALAVETHENWLEAHRYLNMEDLREHKKLALREAA